MHPPLQKYGRRLLASKLHHAHVKLEHEIFSDQYALFIWVCSLHFGTHFSKLLLYALEYALFIRVCTCSYNSGCALFSGKHYLSIRIRKVVAFVECMCNLPSCAMTDEVVHVHENGTCMYM